MRNLNNFLNNLLYRLKIDFLPENACPFGRFISRRISFQTLSPRTIKKAEAASLLIFINSGLRVSDYSVLKITIGKSHNIFEKFLLICFSKTISLQRQIFQVICTSPRPTRILSISASTTVSLSSMSILSQSFIYPLMVSMFRFPYISADI